MKPKDSRRIPLSCKYWFKGMAKTNYRKHKGRQRNQVLEEEIANACDICGKYHVTYTVHKVQ